MSKAQEIWNRLKGYAKTYGEDTKAIFLKWGGLVFISYLLGSTLASAFVMLFADLALQRPKVREPSVSGVRIVKAVNYHRVRKAVLARNLFNSTGEFPMEKAEKAEVVVKSEFNENAACNKSSLGVELLGVIFEGRKSPRSLVTLKEKGYNADIYKVGDAIIGQEQAVIHAIEVKRAVVNNDGVKECIDLKEPKYAKSSNAAASSIPKMTSSVEPEEAESSGTVVLEQGFVDDALGEGFVKILEVGRMVPHNRDSKMIGYKLIGVKNNSLYTKVGLKSGDVLTKVNGISLTQAEQGFAFYNAFSEEKEVRLEFLKKGKTPTTVTIEIK